MARKKTTRTRSRAVRMPKGYVKIELIVPERTRERLLKHCGSMFAVNQFILKHMYDALPIKYEVDELFTFPFGKYEGEKAVDVATLEPSYLQWCKRVIAGFTLTPRMESLVSSKDTETSQTTSPTPDWYDLTNWKPYARFEERISLSPSTGRVFAYKSTQWGERRNWRYLGTVKDGPKV